MIEDAKKKSSNGKDPNEGHRKRMRERYLKEGLENFETHEVIEMLLHCTIPRKDTKAIAKKLKDHCGSIPELFNSSPEKIMQVEGVGINSAVLLSMLGPLFRLYTRECAKLEKVTGAEAITKYMVDRLRGFDSETVLLACIDNRYSLITDVIIGEGSVDESLINKRKAVEMVLKYNATAAIIAHNHPAGFALPSRADLRSTIDLKNTFEAIGVRLIDHIITCPDDYISLAQSRQFSEIF